MNKTKAVVSSIAPLTDSILQIVLSPNKYIDYQAGQYLQILLGNEKLPYSIANAPLGSRTYELHVRHGRGNKMVECLLNEVRLQKELEIELPLGQCYLNNLNPNKPIIFLAKGTGFSPMHAMIEQLLTIDDKRKFELFWGARQKSDLYMDNKVLNWQEHVSRFHYVSILSELGDSTIGQKLLAYHAHDLKDWQIVINGPFAWVYKMRDSLVAAGAPLLFSDAF